MIRQYLSNTNEIGTIPILQNILELNKALMHACITNSHRPALHVTVRELVRVL